MQELAGRRMYLRNFWYAAGEQQPSTPQLVAESSLCLTRDLSIVCAPQVGRGKHLDAHMPPVRLWTSAGISEQVKDKPVGVEILGEKVVLYRDSQGVIQCLHDVCPHRGAPLHRVRLLGVTWLPACLCLYSVVSSSLEAVQPLFCLHAVGTGFWADGAASSASCEHVLTRVPALPQGWVAEVEGHDCVVCPYHGWAFDGEGVLQDVPAAEHQKEWPRKQLVQSYPVKEKVLCLARPYPAIALQR